MLVLIAVVGGVLSGFVATATATWVLRSRAVLDVPSPRSSHDSPTVRGGGVGLAAGTLVSVAIAHIEFRGSSAIALVIAGLAFGAIGFADDLTGELSANLRLALDLVAAVVVATVVMDHTSSSILVAILLGAIAVLWVVSFVNAFNFMDGINGISCAETIVAGAAYGLLARHEHQFTLEVAAFALVAGSIGFAPFNFPTARVFLGDVGSYFAGAWLAVLVIVGLQGSIPIEATVAPVALYGADTATTLIQRVHRHEPWRQAHRQHTYQRLVGLGWSHAQTTSLVFTLLVLCSALGSVSLLGSVAGRLAADCGAVGLIAGYLVLPGLIKRCRSLPRVDGHISRVDP